MESNDIVTRLREIPCNAFARVRIENAADEIERLRSDLSIFRGVAHELDRIRGQLREAAETLERLYMENEQLTAERDEARRMVCGLDADIMEDQVEYARHRGWDCFKEDKPCQ